jgi:hypothetical protein
MTTENPLVKTILRGDPVEGLQELFSLGDSAGLEAYLKILDETYADPDAGVTYEIIKVETGEIIDRALALFLLAE